MWAQLHHVLCHWYHRSHHLWIIIRKDWLFRISLVWSVFTQLLQKHCLIIPTIWFDRWKTPSIHKETLEWDSWVSCSWISSTRLRYLMSHGTPNDPWMVITTNVDNLGHITSDVDHCGHSFISWHKHKHISHCFHHIMLVFTHFSY